jgi:hypothetical protein
MPRVCVMSAQWVGLEQHQIGALACVAARDCVGAGR